MVQLTTRFQRFWGWLGAVPHWLYPTILRQDGALWSQVVICTSLIGCFLTVTGLWVGIARLRRRFRPRRAPDPPPAPAPRRRTPAARAREMRR